MVNKDDPGLQKLRSRDEIYVAKKNFRGVLRGRGYTYMTTVALMRRCRQVYKFTSAGKLSLLL
ncbi:MAG: hypothetical protein WBI55_05250 [Eubacteriales bacterium]|jgi:hypothetical protein|nr:hypothetical protein [Clostridiales bacterium]